MEGLSFSLAVGWRPLQFFVGYWSEKKESEVAQSCLTLCNPMDCSLSPWNFQGKSTGVCCHFLLQGILPTQRLNPGLHIAGRCFTIWVQAGDTVKHLTMHRTVNYLSQNISTVKTEEFCFSLTTSTILFSLINSLAFLLFFYRKS